MSSNHLPSQSLARRARPFTATRHFRVVLTVPTTAKSSGEPVPGAEIYVELEPDDEPIARVVTDGEGTGTFEISKPGTPKYTIKLGLDQLVQLAQLRKANPTATPSVDLQVTETFKQPIPVMLNVTSGPFSQSLSNIEDNG